MRESRGEGIDIEPGVSKARRGGFEVDLPVQRWSAIFGVLTLIKAKF